LYIFTLLQIVVVVIIIIIIIVIIIIIIVIVIVIVIVVIVVVVVVGWLCIITFIIPLIQASINSLLPKCLELPFPIDVGLCLLTN